MRNMIVKRHLSIWLLVASLIISAAMMHPGFAAIIAMGINALILVIMRKSAMIEGSAQIAICRANGR
jgi:hypothetical protein